MLVFNQTGTAKRAQADRIMSVDALRGFDMFWIIGGTEFVLTLAAWIGWQPLTGYLKRELVHPPWHGFNWYDLIMPLFLFVSGVTIPLAVTRKLAQGESRARVFRRITRRLLLLMVLNTIANGALQHLDPHRMRYVGVLARIGLTYFFAAVIVMHTTPRQQVASVLGILAGYWAAMFLIPVPDLGRGMITPEGNLAGYIDRYLLPGVMWGCIYDRLGLYSTLPAITTVLIGALAGQWLFSTSRSDRRKVLGLLAAGVFCWLTGRLVSLSFPINTKVWSPSYVLTAGGWSLILLAAFYLIIDVWRWRSWSFLFMVIGMNSITIYFARNPIDFDALSAYCFTGLATLAGGTAKPLVLASGVLVLEWLFVFFLYRHRIFLRA